MGKILKKITLITSIFVISTLVLSGCNKENEMKALVKTYETMLNEGKYEELYDNISKDSKSYISKEDFIKRYNSIYWGIGSKDIKFSIANYYGYTSRKLRIWRRKLNL